MDKYHCSPARCPLADLAVTCSPGLSHAGNLSSLLVLGFAFSALPAQAQDYFNPAALELKTTEQSVLDLTQFSAKGGQIAGTYWVDIYLNGHQLATRNVTFVEVGPDLQPELTPAELGAMGVKLTAFPALQQLPADQPVIPLEQYIPAAASLFDFRQQRLNISIPQAALTHEVRGYVDPSLWDQGMAAGLLNYNFSGANTRLNNRPGTEDIYYLNLRSGLNLGPWRLRNYSTYSDSNQQRRWNTVNTYLQRDIQALKGQLTLGDSTTTSDIFDSVQYRGAQLASDDNLYPDSLRGFAPVVRGIAQSSAQVTVRQNGYIIYQTYVPAGAFAITDLYPTATGGDLDVTILEDGGTERHFLQPFSAVPLMLREGRMKYAYTLGQYRSIQPRSLTPTFGQSSLIYGLPHNTTVYGGALVAENYNAQALGVGHSFGGLGSLSMDITQARTQLSDDSHQSGQSYRLQYAKEVEVTNTTLTLAGFRYSRKGFFNFQEANSRGFYSDNNWRQYSNKRSKIQVNINQPLREYGNFYVSAYQQDYWDDRSDERNLNLGYNLSLQGISYSLNHTYSQTNGRNANNRQFAFTVEMPLSQWLSNSWASYSVNTSNQGNTTHQTRLSGSALADNNLNYNVQQSYGNRSRGAGGNANVSYKGTYGEMQAGYNYSHDSQQLNYGLQGGIVVHPYGATFSQQQGETLALVRAPKAIGARVQNSTGVRTDWRGYAVVPYISTYRQNRIALDTETLAEGVDVENSIQSVTPTQGAVVLADFRVRVGSRVLMKLDYQDKPIPFGAIAVLAPQAESAENSGIVGADGQLYLSGVPDSGRLNVKWGHATNNQCEVIFTLPAIDIATSVRTFNFECR